jgi:hypothetical protein
MIEWSWRKDELSEPLDVAKVPSRFEAGRATSASAISLVVTGAGPRNSRIHGSRPPLISTVAGRIWSGFATRLWDCNDVSEGMPSFVILAVTPQAAKPMLKEPAQDHLNPNIPKTLPMAKAQLHRLSYTAATRNQFDVGAGGWAAHHSCSAHLGPVSPRSLLGAESRVHECHTIFRQWCARYSGTTATLNFMEDMGARSVSKPTFLHLAALPGATGISLWH